LNKLEPTYLRYVYDGLNKGSLNAENASALPRGFIGLFESEFPADVSSVERISVLRRLTLWALFKGAASTHLASEVLEEDEEDTKTLIDTYSKWFNSPEPGKYILYHDRLRSYFLQKLSSHEVQSLNEKIISYLEAALKDKREDEAQEYALEHLATHMAVESQLDNNYDRLHDFVNQEDLWKRQVRTSKQYKWSQQAVQYGIKEGARRHHEMNTLTSTVNSVKLMQEEQNSAQQILVLFSNGDYQTAISRLERIESCVRLKLSILLIHDLTLGVLKDTHFKKDACLELLKLISKIKDDNLNWTEYYPLSVMYFIHKELKNMSLVPEPIWNKGEFNLVSLLDFKNSEESNKLTKLELLDSIKETKLLILKHEEQLKGKNKQSREYSLLKREIEYQNLEIKLAAHKIDHGNFRKDESLLLESIDLNIIKEINFYNSDLYNRIDTYFLILENHFGKEISKDTQYKSMKNLEYQVECSFIEGDEVITLILECLELIPKEIKLFIEKADQYSKKESRYINYRVRLANLLYKQSNHRNEFFKNIKKWNFVTSYENLSSILDDSAQLDFFDQLKFLHEIVSQLSDVFVYHNTEDIISLADGLVNNVNIHDNSITYAYTYLAYISLKLSNTNKAFDYTQIAIKELERLVAKHNGVLQQGVSKIDAEDFSFKELCAMDLSKLKGKIDQNYATKNIGNIPKLYDLCIDLYVELLKNENFSFTDSIKDFTSTVVIIYENLILEGDEVKIENNLIFEDKLNKTIKKLVSDGFIDISKSINSTFSNKEVIQNFFTSDIMKELKIENFDIIHTDLVSLIYDENFNDISYTTLLERVMNNEFFDSSKKYLIILHLIEQKHYDSAVQLISIVEDKNIYNDSINSILESLSIDSQISSLNLSVLILYLQKSDVLIENIFKKCISILNLIKNEDERQIINKIVLDLINKEKHLEHTQEAFQIILNQPMTLFNKEHYLDSLRNKLLSQIDQITTLDNLKDVKGCLGEKKFRLNIVNFLGVANNLLIEDIKPVNYKNEFESITKSLDENIFSGSSLNGLDDIYMLCLEFECFDIAGYCYTVILESFPMIFNIYESILSNKIIMTNSFDREFEIDFDMIEYSESMGELIPRFRELGFEYEANELKYIISDYDVISNGYDGEYFELAILDTKRGELNSALSRLNNMELDSMKDLSIYYMSKVLISQNNIKPTSKLINQVTHDYFKSLIFFDVCIHCYKSGDNDSHAEHLESCLKLVSSFASQWRKDSILLKIWKFYFELGKLDKAEVFLKKIVFEAFKFSAEFICIKERLKKEGEDSNLFLEFKEKVESIDLHFDTNLLYKLENINNISQDKILDNDELTNFITDTAEFFLSDMTIYLREQIALCKKNELNDKLLFIQNKLEPYKLQINDPDSQIKGCNLKILLADLYYTIGDTKKLNRILLRF